MKPRLKKKRREIRLYVYQGVDGYWRWRLVASNGRTAADCGQLYTRRVNALKGARYLYQHFKGLRCPAPYLEQPPSPPQAYQQSGKPPKKKRRTMGDELLLGS